MAAPTLPERVLIIRPSALGDVCRTVPVLASLARAWPEATFGWVVQAGFEDAIRSHPDLDEVIAFPRQGLARWATSPRVLAKSLGWLKGLRRGAWNCVIDCQGLGRSGLMTRATRASLRVGDRGAREGAWLFYNRRVDTRSIEHTVDKMLALLTPLQVDPVRDMRLYPPPEGRADWTNRRRAMGLESPFVALATTTRWPSKAWPDDHWVQCVSALVARGLPSVVLLGSASEQSEVDALAARLDRETAAKVHNVAGRTSIAEMMALIESARLTIANDTAALHMAVGLGGRCVGLFGPTDPGRVGPVDLRAHVAWTGPLSAVNYRDRSLGGSVMRQLSVESVLSVISHVLESTMEPMA